MGSAGTCEASADQLDLLPLSVSRPQEALRRARQLLAADPPALEASVARQAIGIVLRDFGDSREAVRELRAALRLARVAGSRRREADVLATLGIALVLGGRTVGGRGVLDDAVALADGADAGRILMRRGGAMLIIGDHRAAMRDLNRAVRILRGARDALWHPRALTARAFTHLGMGAVERARADMLHAEHLLDAGGQQLESARARQNRGVIAFRDGDLPAALTCLDEAGERFAALGVDDPELSLDRCHVLLAAGLPHDAMEVADTALAHLESIRGQFARHAELLLVAATAALAAGRPDTSGERAVLAGQLFAAQRRGRWRVHARLVELQARFAGGEVSARLLRDAERTATALDQLADPEAAVAHLLAGRLGAALQRRGTSDRHLAAAAAARRRGPGTVAAVGWIAEALRAEAEGDGRRLLHACRRGLRAIDEQRDAMGSSELRAQVTLHGSALAALAQRHVLHHGSPRRLLVWSERWRGSALAAPPVRPPADPAMRADLAALREITSRIEGGPVVGSKLRRERGRLERDIRARAWRAASTGTGGVCAFDIDAVFDELGTDRLLQLVEVDGQLHVLVCGDGRVRRYPAGRTDDAAREVELARFGLKRVLRRPDGATLARLEAAGPLLSAALLGGARHHLGEGAVVVVPPGKLHAVPWALLPELRDRAVSVAPSASAWLRARRAPAAPTGRVALIHGPGLVAAEAEVAELARAYPDATVLGGGSATASRVLAVLDGTDLAHIAAHGTFRADSPLFSSLHLDDGPLTVHDLEQLGRAPRRMVLPSCDSGLLTLAGSDELLGLTSSLLPLGTVGVVAGVVPISDVATVPIMTRMHHHLRQGHPLAEALRRARPGPGADPAAIATGWSFVSLGAG